MDGGSHQWNATYTELCYNTYALTFLGVSQLTPLDFGGDLFLFY